jgi:hypothetical protein
MDQQRRNHGVSDPGARRWIPSRTRPEGSLTPWLSVPKSKSVQVQIAAVDRRRFRNRCRADLSEVVRAVRHVFLPAILARLRTKKLAEMLTPAITRLSLDLCSAPSRRVASLRPRDPERLRP